MEKKKVLSVMVTEAQRAAIRRAMDRDKSLTRRADKSMSGLANKWFAEYCERMGVEWPDDERSQWGGPRE